MERMALIGDIHGNLPALEAVLADIDRRAIERIICLGDVAGKGPSGAAVVDLCRQRCAVTLQGNWDAFLAHPQDHSAIQWYRQELGPERLAWLGRLPFRYDFVMSGRRIRLVHASPQGVTTRVHQTASREELLAMFDTTDLTDPGFVPDVVAYADIHTPFVRTFHQGTLINIGSVGNPLDVPLAAWALLEGMLDDPTPAPWGVQIVRVPYDIDRAIADAREAGFPETDVWERELITARYRFSAS
jgi:predicted phosphodiesterase